MMGLRPEGTKLFKGKIKTLCLTTTLHYYRPPKSGDDLEQTVMITSNGYVKVHRRVSNGWKREKSYDFNTKNVRVITEERKMPSGQTVRILNRIRRYFAETHLGCYICDSSGEWQLELTNTEGEIFLFDGFFDDYRESLSRTSNLIRAATGLKYLLGFCDDNQ